MSFEGIIEIWCLHCRKCIGKSMEAEDTIEIEREHRETYGHSRYSRVWGRK